MGQSQPSGLIQTVGITYINDRQAEIDFLPSHRKNMCMTSGNSERYSQGMQTRRDVLGDAHVDCAEASKTAFDAPFQEMIVEAAWGHVWSGDGLTPRERSLITLALLAGLGQDKEFTMHVRAARNTGASQDDIREALMHVAIYAGVPAANHAISLAKTEFSKPKEGYDPNG